MDYFEDLTAVLLYGAVGIALLVVGYRVIDLLTPGHLGRQLCERPQPQRRDRGPALLAIGAS